MKTLSTIDDEIEQLEQRIAAERLALAAAFRKGQASVREQATSPKALAAVAGIGFVAGRLLFGSRQRPEHSRSGVAPRGVVGLAGALAMAALQPNSAAGSAMRWAYAKFREQRARSEAGDPFNAPRYSARQAARSYHASGAAAAEAAATHRQAAAPASGTGIHPTSVVQ